MKELFERVIDEDGVLGDVLIENAKEDPVHNAREGNPLDVSTALTEVNALIAAIARAHGERAPVIDQELMRAVLTQLLRQQGGPQQRR